MNYQVVSFRDVTELGMPVLWNRRLMKHEGNKKYIFVEK
jgi:hypothetical protein